MDVILGLTGKDYVMCVTDTTAIRSIFTLKHDERKVSMIDRTKFLACGGDIASRTAFTEYIERNFALSQLRTDLELSNHAAANFIRNELAKAIRSRGGAYQAQPILGGVDENGPALYFLDYLGSLEKVDFAAQGYASYFSLSVMDKFWKKNMTLEEGKALMIDCLKQLKVRFIVHNPTFKLVVVTKEGKTLEEIISV
mmetsp:Transcript_8950/g.14559  ORF Transcript_8950/g.14559 Transcript_8950/m.14559 type:complete len:197 (+) Transcript_8950:116-706(+)|eukprot:CAMPEP_0203765822 /NCGR_PEP_ID=MMETSP0099_2-20121227/77_1 /ASSEMBLY_ACC=CAM_ASM_000209 /TAXON_ID=96639 /ORGANISM=" , Strain NY0313808BC1" /LENGTH=196 /DNA_ID=CAMNT_0050662107 /DNA_START=126 /DNA_END=716 /DNA_ORIENTATION=+